jgi:hypothetical protein
MGQLKGANNVLIIFDLSLIIILSHRIFDWSKKDLINKHASGGLK